MLSLVRETATSHYNVHLNLNKIPKIVIDFFCIKTLLRCGYFNLYFRYDNREFQLNKRSAFTISKFYYMMTP